MNDLSTTRTPRLFGSNDAASPFTWLRSEIDSLFDTMSGPGRGIFAAADRRMAPAVNLVEGAADYTLTAELPGLTEKDINLTVADGVLEVTGEKQETTEQKEGGFLLKERRFGAFERRVALPDDADLDNIRARYVDGILTVTVPKDANAKPRARKIEIE